MSDAEKPKGYLRRQYERLKKAWLRALEENADPYRFAWAVALGAFITAGPFYGIRLPSAIGVAWVARLNRLTAALSSHLLPAPLCFPLFYYEIKLGAAILGRSVPPWPARSSEVVAAMRDALLSWAVGGLLVAPFAAALAFFLAYPSAVRYRARKARKAAEAAGAS